MINWFVYGLSLSLAVISFLNCGVKGKIILVSTVGVCIISPFIYHTFLVKQISFVALIIIGICCYLFLQWKQILPGVLK
jgi:hypothetical protein